MALSPFNLTQRRSHFSLQPHPKAIALSPFNLTQTRSHPFYSIQSRPRIPS
ncbi:hypothetical protein [Coleofasciculus chthonoplastes]|uniref:hypothetical protein n=1 Tax=Coleofasciculus chthonoplastes TaxID=64178 RepID=UPI0012F985BC|nr:hypothetical protein [Coleofasciculus chthonoplastes]